MTRPMFWREYYTQKELRELIQSRVNPQPFGTPFEDELISDLILERHYFCSLKGLRPSAFKKTRDYKPYGFCGLFAHGWHPVSWSCCLEKPSSDVDRIVRALRDHIVPDKIAYRKSHPKCEHCGTAPSVEVHHANPTFEEIARKVLTDVTGDEIQEALNAWDWFKPEKFALQRDLELVRKFDEIHSGAHLEALCRTCHNKTKKGGTKAVSYAEQNALQKRLE